MSQSSLFRLGTVQLSSGRQASWKIECDSLTAADWDCLAHIAIERNLVRPFASVIGVPRGGLPFANALRPYVTPDADTVLVVDDVYTTGRSIWKVMLSPKAETSECFCTHRVYGLVAFARTPIRGDIIKSIWTLGGKE
jgi:orotate phosphoribosyltransferase